MVPPTRGVSRLGAGRNAAARAGGIEVSLFQVQLARESEVEDLDQTAVRKHDVRRLQVAMEDAELMRCGEAVRDLDARRENKLKTRRALANHLVQ